MITMTEALAKIAENWEEISCIPGASERTYEIAKWMTQISKGKNAESLNGHGWIDLLARLYQRGWDSVFNRGWESQDSTNVNDEDTNFDVPDYSPDPADIVATQDLPPNMPQFCQRAITELRPISKESLRKELGVSARQAEALARRSRTIIGNFLVGHPVPRYYGRKTSPRAIRGRAGRVVSLKGGL